MSLSIERFSTKNLGGIKEYYTQHGFVIVNDAYEDDTMADFEQEYLMLINETLRKSEISIEIDASNPEYISEAIKQLESVDHKWVANIYDTSAMLPAFLGIVRNARTIKIIQYLLGLETPLYPYTNRIRIDPPSDNRRTYGWHQETFYTIPRSSFVQTWAPLIYDTRIANGTISVADGSHVEGIPKQTWTENPGGATQILIPDEIVNKYVEIPIEMNKGELLFFSGRLAHKSGNNISNRVRFSLVGMYHDISSEGFIAPSIEFSHKHEDPREYFEYEMNRINY
jgi:ectoine hydroxylase-related dioxygenase (phytanoyl-CoA dioxygenase family)